MKLMLGVQSLLLVVAIGAIGWLTMRVSALETRLDAATSTIPVAGLKVQLPPSRRGKSPPLPFPVQAPTQLNAQVEAQVEAKVEDKLWSEEGRAAIDDVVDERDTRQQEKRSERFRKMGEIRRERLIEELTAELDLDEPTAQTVRDAITAAGEARSALWQKMRGDEDVDPAELVDAREAIQVDLEEQLTEAIGEDATKDVLQRLRRR